MRKKIYFEQRPWGNFKQFVLNERCTVKILTLNSKQRLSLQSHAKRDELWVALDPGLQARIGSRIIKLKKGQEIFIPKRTKHSIASLGKKGRVLEISFGFFKEKDEKRFNDIYKRV